MTLESIRKFCKRLPHASEDIKWGHDLCFLIGGKMFAVASLEPADRHSISFKCMPDEFVELVEVSGIIPAPYMARNHWVTLERFDALRDAEIEEYVRRSYEMVKAKLTKSALAELAHRSDGSPRKHGDTEKEKPKKGESKGKSKSKGKTTTKAKAKAKD